MVIENVFEKVETKISLDLGASVPFQFRALSAVFDYVVFSPLVWILTVSMFNSEISLIKNFSSSEQAFGIGLYLLSFSVLVFALLQSVFIFRFGGTPGQILMKIKNTFGEQNIFLFLQIFVRQLGFCVSGLCFGIPWLSVIVHPEGKTFYERLTEGTLIRTSEAMDQWVRSTDRKYLGFSLSTALVFLFLVFTAGQWVAMKKLLVMPYESLLGQNSNVESSQCEKLNDTNALSKLQIMIALNLVGLYQDSCLDKELDHQIWKNFSSEEKEIKALAYFGKFVLAGSYESEQKYLDLTCNIKADSEGCMLSQFVLTPEKNENDFRRNILKSATGSPLAAVISYEVFNDKFIDLQNWKHVKIFNKYLITEKLSKMSMTRFPASETSQTSKTNEMQKIISEILKL